MLRAASTRGSGARGTVAGGSDPGGHNTCWRYSLSDEHSSVAAADEALRDEHERLRLLLRRLRARPDRAELVTLLHQLPELLAEHFRSEERPGGLYDAVGISLPEARGQVAQLVDDHFRLVAVARDLAASALAPDVAAQALLEQALRVADYLSDHEQRERHLVRSSLGAP